MDKGTLAAASQSLVRPQTSGVKRRVRTGTIILYAAMFSLSVVFLFPFFWTLSSSLKEVWELMNFPPTWLPASPQWANYARVIDRVPFLLWTRNSLVVVVASTTGAILSASVVAFSFARFKYRGRDLIFMLTLGTMMLPAQVTMIPQYVLFNRMGWIDTLRPLWVPAWLGGGAFNIFLLRQFMMSLPTELDEAAIIDGASYPQVFRRITFPLCGPALATVAVISFIGGWNDFQGPLIYLNTTNRFTLALGLNYFKGVPEAGGVPMDNLLMAASILATLPCLILFFSAQRYFVQGIVLTGIKG
jgi:multiple sugar transport system permease protein